MGDTGGAFTYLKRARQLDDTDINTLFAISAAHLKKGENNEAIMRLLTILDIDPRNRRAKRSLKLIRDAISEEMLYDLIQSEKIKTIYPPTGLTIPTWVIFSIAAIVIIPLSILVIQDIGLFSINKEIRSVEIDRLTLETSQNIVSTTGEYRLILSEKEIKETFEKAKKHFNKYEDNLAQREINRILTSNASEKVKEKAHFLMSYFRTPTFSSLKNSFSYETVQKEPFLYQNCYVIWKGRISNLAISEKAITFDFLVGYHDQKVLEGIVPVTLDFAVDLEQGYPIELLGKINYDSLITLVGLSVHKLAP